MSDIHKRKNKLKKVNVHFWLTKGFIVNLGALVATAQAGNVVLWRGVLLEEAQLQRLVRLIDPTEQEQHETRQGHIRR